MLLPRTELRKKIPGETFKKMPKTTNQDSYEAMGTTALTAPRLPSRAWRFNSQRCAALRSSAKRCSTCGGAQPWGCHGEPWW